MKVAVDTNRLTGLFRGDGELPTWLGTCDEVWIPPFVLAEIKAGFEGGTQRQRNEILLREFLATATVDVLLPGRETAEQYARVPDNDLWIAAARQVNYLVRCRATSCRIADSTINSPLPGPTRVLTTS